MSLTVEQMEQCLPAHLKTFATQSLVDRVNNAVSDPLIAEQIQENYVSYTSVLKEGKFKIDDYLNAIMYVSYKLMGMSNQDAWMRTFPQRHAQLLANGNSTAKDISPYVHAYNKGKLVNLIMEQTLVPSWVLNQHLYQKALNVQADLMVNAASEMVRTTAANSILTQLAKPKEVGPLVNLNLTDNSGMNELKQLLGQMATKQVELVGKGVPIKDLAADKIVDV